MTTASCPSCGGPIEFRIGSSAVVVCNYCRTVVARTDRGVADFGKVAALIDTGSPLRIDLPGKYHGVGFRITGRTQLRHQAGGVWDEWYAAFDDGRWGWLAEAQGRYYVTFKVAATAPAYDQLDLGTRVPGLDEVIVTELGTATLASAEGEIPWKPVPESSYAYADLAGGEGHFATIDYSEEPPVVFKGQETSLRELGLSGAEAQRKRVAVTKLSCTACGGPLDLRLGDQAERIICPHCGAAHDITEGKLQFIQMKQRKAVEPVIPLGTTGTIDGDAYVVAGFMQRSVRFDRDYFWTEYLLFNAEKGFRWLVNSDEHWSFVTPLSPGEVRDDGTAEQPARYVGWKGQSFRLFQTAEAHVRYVIGEFYWKVKVGEAVATADYVKPPQGLSKEVTRSGAREVAWSHARYETTAAIEKAFGVKDLARPSTVGPMQPNPAPKLGCVWLGFVAALFVTALVLMMMAPRREVAKQMFDLVPAAGSLEPTQTFFIENLALTGKDNIEVEGYDDLENSWVYVAGDLVDVDTGMLDSFEMPIEYYHGVDSGESWSEGSRGESRYLAPPARKGRYALRLDVQWDPGKTPPPLHITVREGVFRWPPFLLAFILITIVPALTIWRRLSFETQRWKDSDFSPYPTSSGDDEDDD